jgi:hypothetical protein
MLLISDRLGILIINRCNAHYTYIRTYPLQYIVLLRVNGLSISVSKIALSTHVLRRYVFLVIRGLIV